MTKKSLGGQIWARSPENCETAYHVITGYKKHHAILYKACFKNIWQKVENMNQKSTTHINSSAKYICIK